MCPGNQSPCPPSQHGDENAFLWDPRLPPLLKHALPQREFWWVNKYHGSAPVSGTVREFLGVPKDVFLDQGRYVTASGCVPHDCGDRGMLWIDTAVRPATLVFVATGAVTNAKGDNVTHLWLFASRQLDFESLPPAFLASLQRWREINTADHDAEDVILATLVQPSGQMVDLSYPTLNFPKNQSGAKQ